ncbi:MAG: anti-sigma factor family protein [Planctomycetota bacterium]
MNESQLPSNDAPLTELQARSMAYIDDELDSKERTEFEELLAKDPELAAEVTGHQSLMHLTSSMALLEPGDHEIRRFWAHFYNRNEWRIGWFLLVMGVITLTGFGIFELLISGVHWIIKAAVLSALAGGCLVLWSAVRLKVRTARFDRYRGVMR